MGTQGMVATRCSAAQAEVFALVQRGDSDSLALIGEDYVDTIDAIDALKNQPTGTITGTPSGISDLDLCTGGFQPKQLIVTAGRPAGIGSPPGGTSPTSMEPRVLPRPIPASAQGC
ncbi:hypothetical protein P8605_12630 [Streptomyces sp. T-3]|nr:hypothetical protein [Streptomyces sp. T-3]